MDAMSVAEVAEAKQAFEDQVMALVQDFNRRTGAHVTKIELYPAILKTFDGKWQYVLDRPTVEVQVLSAA